MNSYLVIATLCLCILFFTGLVSAMVLLGIPLLAAFAILYAATVWCMSGMLRRAREYADSGHHTGRRHGDVIRPASEPQVYRVIGANQSLKL